MLKKSTPTLRISPCTASGLTCQLSVTLKKTFCVSSEAAATEPSPAALSLKSARCTLMSTRRRLRQGAMNCGPSPTWPTILPNSETTPTSPAGIGWYDRKSVSPMLVSTNTTTTAVIGRARQISRRHHLAEGRPHRQPEHADERRQDDDHGDAREDHYPKNPDHQLPPCRSGLTGVAFDGARGADRRSIPGRAQPTTPVELPARQHE